MVEQARLADVGSGLAPATEGWFVVNVADAWWDNHDHFGASCMFEGRESELEFAQLGVRITVLEPGQSGGLYHGEDTQEGFLVLAGDCLLLVEGEERPLRRFDYFHCPPRTEHILVGAGEGPCAVLSVGARRPGRPIHYAVSELALRHGAGVTEPTPSPRDAYATYADERIERPRSWDALPWAERFSA
jgi:uncharacterized cupin superfamily protein